MPVGFELSSSMYIVYAFGNNIYSLSSITIYIFLVWQTYFVFCITNNLGNWTHMCIMPTKCQVYTIKYSTFCKPYLFFHVYNPLSIQCLADISGFFWKCMWRFTVIHKEFTFGSHICSFIPMTTYGFLVWQTYFFFLIYVNIFWNYTYMCIYTKY